MITYECPGCQGRFRSDDAPNRCPLCGFEPDQADGRGTRGGFAVAGFDDD